MGIMACLMNIWHEPDQIYCCSLGLVGGLEVNPTLVQRSSSIPHDFSANIYAGDLPRHLGLCFTGCGLVGWKSLLTCVMLCT